MCYQATEPPKVVYTCECCGVFAREYDLFDHNGYVYCSYCLDDKYTVCDDCGERIGKEDMQTDTICYECSLFQPPLQVGEPIPQDKEAA